MGKPDLAKLPPASDDDLPPAAAAAPVVAPPPLLPDGQAESSCRACDDAAFKHGLESIDPVEGPELPRLPPGPLPPWRMRKLRRNPVKQPELPCGDPSSIRAARAITERPVRSFGPARRIPRPRPPWFILQHPR